MEKIVSKNTHKKPPQASTATPETNISTSLEPKTLTLSYQLVIITLLVLYFRTKILKKIHNPPPPYKKKNNNNQKLAVIITYYNNWFNFLIPIHPKVSSRLCQRSILVKAFLCPLVNTLS